MTSQNRLIEAVPTSIHILCSELNYENFKFIPVKLSFGVRGSKFKLYVIMMTRHLAPICSNSSSVNWRQLLRERLRTHKVFTKDQCFYLNYHKFSRKSYVLDVY